MTEKRFQIDRAILAIALPAIVNNVTVPLLGICDTAIAGHLGDSRYIAAMAVGAMMINVVYWLCGFLRMGTSGMTAQAYGASDFGEMRRILLKALTIGLIISIVTIFIQTPLLKLLLIIISPEEEVRELASMYFRIGIWSAPAQLCVMAASGWFIGRQNTVIPMIISIGVNILNIVLSLLLVFVFGEGFYGIIIGTLVASYAGALSILAMAMHKIRSETSRVSGTTLKIAGDDKLGFLSMNVPLFFRSACMMCVTLGMTSVGARLGAATLAANSVIMQFFLFFSYFMDGFAFAGEALVGKFVGAKDIRLLKQSVKCLLKWGVGMALTFFAIYSVAGEWIVSLLTDVESVRRIAKSMYVWLILLPPITVCAFLFDGIFIGLARTLTLFYTTLLASLAYFIITFANGLPANTQLWTAFETYLFMRGALLGLEYFRIQRKSLIL